MKPPRYSRPYPGPLDPDTLEQAFRNRGTVTNQVRRTASGTTFAPGGRLKMPLRTLSRKQNERDKT